MTHRTVTRAMFLFTGSLAAAAVAFGCLANRPPRPVAGTAPAQPMPGEALFQSYCTGCHTLDEAVLYARAAGSAEAARRNLGELLAAHGDSSPAEDALIVDFVLSKR